MRLKNGDLLLGACVCLALSWWRFDPFAAGLLGDGGDSVFNLWTYEHIWGALNTHGVSSIFSGAMWDGRIFHPARETFALSDNQLYAGLLSWPAHSLLNAASTMNLLALLLVVLAYVCMWFLLRTLNVSPALRAGFALLYAQCPWLNDHYLHFQNICIFVFPLALHAWFAWRADRSRMKAALVVLAFALPVGLNLYFQIWLDITLVLLLIGAARRSKDERKTFALLLVATVALQLPVFVHYFAASAESAYQVFGATMHAYRAHFLTSFLTAHSHRPLLDLILPYPLITPATIEEVGFVGLLWVPALILVCVRVPQTRPWLVVAAIAYWFSLGPFYGPAGILPIVPGLNALRAIGRMQLLFSFFSLIALAIGLSHFKLKHTIPLLLGISLEWLTLEKGKRHPIDESCYQGDSELARSLPPGADLLFVDPDIHWVQACLARVPVRLHSGYSGRVPLHAAVTSAALSGSLPGQKDETRAQHLSAAIRFAKPAMVATRLAETAALLRSMPGLEDLGAKTHGERQVFLFRPQTVEEGVINLETDLEYDHVQRGHPAIVQARTRQAGHISMRSLLACRLVESWSSFLPTFTQRQALPVEFNHVDLPAGAMVFEKRSRAAFLRLPESVRPRLTLGVQCDKSRL